MANKVLQLIKESGAKWVDFRFTDTKGKEQHVTYPADTIDEDTFEDGKMFDGSSIAGWKGIEASDIDHLADPAHAGQLSALMQGGGFLLAAIAPWLIAVFHGLTGGYTLGWIWHLAMVVVVSILVIRLNPTHYAKAIRLEK